MDELRKRVLRFSVITRIDNDVWKCVSTDGSLKLHLSEHMFPNAPYPYKEYVMTYDDVNYLIEDAPPCVDCHREQKDELLNLIDKISGK